MNPEQPVLDEIDRLVDWQIEDGHRRGDGPARGPAHEVMRTASFLGNPSPFVPNGDRWWWPVLPDLTGPTLIITTAC